MFKPAVLLTLLFAAGVACAADSVTDVMQKAYAPYRVALFKTNSNDQYGAQQAVAQAQRDWRQIVTQFGSMPPAPYDRDAAFANSLTEVDTVYAKATQQIEKGLLGEAHETLEHARDVMAELRRRNQVIVYSDHMNAYHAQMERVLVDGEKLLGKPDGLPRLLMLVGALEFLAERLKSEAPVDYLKNPEFNTLVSAVDKSVANLKAALLSQDPAAVRDATSKIKGPYSRMFIKFG